MLEEKQCHKTDALQRRFFFLSFVVLFLESKQAAVQRLLCAKVVYESEQLEPPYRAVTHPRGSVTLSVDVRAPLRAPNKVEMRSFLFVLSDICEFSCFSFPSPCVGLPWPFIHPLHCCAAGRRPLASWTCLDKQRKVDSRDPDYHMFDFLGRLDVAINYYILFLFMYEFKILPFFSLFSVSSDTQCFVLSRTRQLSLTVTSCLQ